MASVSVARVWNDGKPTTTIGEAAKKARVWVESEAAKNARVWGERSFPSPGF